MCTATTAAAISTHSPPPPLTPGDVPPLPDAESGRGLLLVTALADPWGMDLSAPPLKTVWAELDDHPRPQANRRLTEEA